MNRSFVIFAGWSLLFSAALQIGVLAFIPSILSRSSALTTLAASFGILQSLLAFPVLIVLSIAAGPGGGSLRLAGPIIGIVGLLIQLVLRVLLAMHVLPAIDAVPLAQISFSIGVGLAAVWLVWAHWAALRIGVLPRWLALFGLAVGAGRIAFAMFSLAVFVKQISRLLYDLGILGALLSAVLFYLAAIVWGIWLGLLLVRGHIAFSTQPLGQ